MIEIFRKADGQKVSNTEYLEFIRNKMVNKIKGPLSDHFIMKIDGQEVDIDSIGFNNKKPAQ